MAPYPKCLWLHGQLVLHYLQMTMHERDSLDIVINGEWASEKDLDYLDSLAEGMLEDESTLTMRCLYYVADTPDNCSPSLFLQTMVDEDELIPGSAVRIELKNFEEEEGNFVLLYSPDNELIQLPDTSDESDVLFEGKTIVEDLLDNYDALDHPGRIIAEQLRRVIGILQGVNEADSLSMLPQGQHMADFVRGLVTTRSTYAVQAKEYCIPISEEADVRIIVQRPLGVVEGNPVDAHLLQICFEDREQSLEWYYCKGLLGDRELFVTDAKVVEEDYSDEEMEDDRLEELLDELLPHRPTQHDVKTLINALLEAQAIEAGHYKATAD